MGVGCGWQLYDHGRQRERVPGPGDLDKYLPEIGQPILPGRADDQKTGVPVQRVHRLPDQAVGGEGG